MTGKKISYYKSEWKIASEKFGIEMRTFKDIFTVLVNKRGDPLHVSGIIAVNENVANYIATRFPQEAANTIASNIKNMRKLGNRDYFSTTLLHGLSKWRSSSEILLKNNKELANNTKNLNGNMAVIDEIKKLHPDLFVEKGPLGIRVNNGD